MFILLACIIAAFLFTVIFLFGSLALLSGVIVAVAFIGNLLSAGAKADDQVYPVPGKT
ncbi:MAG TPA: hypothetical protein VMI10_10295 [Terriglobales bacterium]|nr:hypothetical protein [Terriglobales bacterium]